MIVENVQYGERVNGKFWRLRLIARALFFMLRHKRFVIVSIELENSATLADHEDAEVDSLFCGLTSIGAFAALNEFSQIMYDAEMTAIRARQLSGNPINGD